MATAEVRDSVVDSAAEDLRCSGHSGGDEVVDTTSAGDAFDAGVLAAVLDGKTQDEALAIGTACGALTAGVVGVRTTRSRDAIEAFRETH